MFFMRFAPRGQEFSGTGGSGFGEIGINRVAGKFARSFFGAANGESDLGGVEELAGIFLADGAEQHAVGDTGYKVAAVVAAGERGQKGAVGLRGFVRGADFEPAYREFLAIGILEGPGAAGDGVVCEGRAGIADGLKDLRLVCHAWFLPYSS